MDINQKMLLDLAAQIGVDSKNPNAARSAEGVARQYQGKSEDELMGEILRLKDSMKSNRAQYEKQIKAIRSLRGMMNQEQRARLDRVLQLLDD